MAEFPALPLFTDALIADTQHLTDEEFGAYIRLLILSWRTANCKLPADPAWHMRRLNADSEKYNRLHRTLLEEFFQSDGNYLYQKRLVKEFGYLREQSQKQSARAKSRWNKENDPCRGNATDGICRDDASRARTAPAPTRPRAEKRNDSVTDKALNKNESDLCRGNAASGNAPHPTPPTDKKEYTPVTPKQDSPYPGTEIHPRFNEVREYIVNRLPSLNRQNATEVNRWLHEGADPELDIYPNVDSAIEYKRGDIGSFRYFANPVMSSVKVRKEQEETMERLRSKCDEAS